MPEIETQLTVFTDQKSCTSPFVSCEPKFFSVGTKNTSNYYIHLLSKGDFSRGHRYFRTKLNKKKI